MVHAFISLALLLPYRLRVRAFGAVTARIIGPMAGFVRRGEGQLRLAMPDLSPAERRRISRASLNNFARSIIESYSYKEFAQSCEGMLLNGPGADALARAKQDRRPIILFTGHFGNYADIHGGGSARAHTRCPLSPLQQSAFRTQTPRCSRCIWAFLPTGRRRPSSDAAQHSGRKHHSNRR